MCADAIVLTDFCVPVPQQDSIEHRPSRSITGRWEDRLTAAGLMGPRPCSEESDALLDCCHIDKIPYKFDPRIHAGDNP